MQASAAAPPLGKSVVLLALRRRFAALRPDLEISPAGCVGRIEDNLLPGVEPRHFVEDLRRGDGNEIESKFRAVHSSAALAVNTFARFKDEPAHLMLAGDSGFEALTFERACPTGLCGGRPPNLDLLAQGSGRRGRGRVQAHRASTADHAVLLACLWPADTRRAPRRSLVSRDGDGARQSGQLRLARCRAADQHAFGLARCFKGKPVTLLYLYWEPQDADRDSVILAHRREIERFACLVAGGFPAFRAQSHRELWAQWREAMRPSWPKDHVANLRARYDVPLSGAAPG